MYYRPIIPNFAPLRRHFNSIMMEKNILDSYFFRYLLSSVFAYSYTIISVIVLSKISFLKIEVVFFLSQFSKAIILFLIQKHFTFRNNDNKTLEQLKHYTITLILFKLIEYCGVLLINLVSINYLINITIVLFIASILKYFVFKRIFVNSSS